MRNFISTRIAQTPPSGIRKFFDIAATMKTVISLGIGEPDFVTPEPILRAGIDSLQRGETQYTSNSGTVELRAALSKHLGRLYGVHYNPEDEVIVTVGVSEALYLALTAVVNPGDEIIIPEPCFVAYGPEAIFAGGVPVMVPTYVENGFQVTAEIIEAAITPKTKAILLGYPSNPTGAVMTREVMAGIAALAEERDLLLISDEIYDQLVYGIEHVCVSGLPGMRDRTILLGGFSKDYAMTGWRIGYACANPELLAAMRKVHQYTIMSAPTTAQAAAVVALEHGEEHVAQMRQEYDRRRRLIVDGFNTLGLDCFEPRGAFYAFPSIAASGLSSDDFAMRLLEEEEVAVVPGDAFGPSGAGYVRASYATAYEKIEEALNRIESFMRRHG
ncbi:MAG: aminotransferase class I/II-fold pyridoxal phosphate-dependent enzyme [Chloroflexi bacterium]|nr:aminotransferase class I/II-fold pyridoxal phosphate-dependent enzyme [Chloroflexota bacterium]MCI0578325.1 aminotransferase class I/II-fold pyridoxal phosphate-dependent enzyme [Chloroflexota bacterium]MCI0649007.1 aminotransferase class I/II-fold pyridoxal phosphate-dependent enzyme [Chloroflexota bacterium]MCI0729442.1 aminotransferase class I/II-fold pyridoxal phosphate-dependent enzyme [Chloroflexota bacterium]